MVFLIYRVLFEEYFAKVYNFPILIILKRAKRSRFELLFFDYFLLGRRLLKGNRILENMVESFWLKFYFLLCGVEYKDTLR